MAERSRRIVEFALAVLLVGAGLALLAYGLGWFSREPEASGQTVERLIPTAAASGAAAGSPSVAPTPPAPPVTRLAEPGLFSPRQRIGFVAPLRDVERYDVAQLGAGWHISCQQGEDPVPAAGM
ncbi:MAG: hypothetical protein ACK2UU_11500, partial [Anaerolineae bacterium]